MPIKPLPTGKAAILAAIQAARLSQQAQTFNATPPSAQPVQAMRRQVETPVDDEPNLLEPLPEPPQPDAGLDGNLFRRLDGPAPFNAPLLHGDEDAVNLSQVSDSDLSDEDNELLREAAAARDRSDVFDPDRPLKGMDAQQVFKDLLRELDAGGGDEPPGNALQGGQQSGDDAV